MTYGNSTNAPFSAIDALAALTPDGSLLLSLVHRGSFGPIHLAIALDDFNSTGTAELRTLTAPHPWSSNSLQAPQTVHPLDSTAVLQENKLALDLAPYSVVRVRLPRKKA